MSKAIASSKPARRATRPAPTTPPAGPGDEQPRRMRRGLVDRSDAARGEHHDRLGQPRLGRRAGERAQVARRDRPEVGVGGGRRRALVLPELGRDLVRGDDVDAGMAPPQLRRDRLLVRRIAEREQQADGDRLRVAEVGKRVELERLELALRPEPAAHAVAALERHERLGMLGAEAVEMGARLPAQVEEVLEARVADVRGARAAPLEERVRGDGRPVREARRAPRPRRPRAPRRAPTPPAAPRSAPWPSGPGRPRRAPRR